MRHGDETLRAKTYRNGEGEGGMSFQAALQLLGGVGLFLFAIKHISESLQRIAGDRLRQLLGMLTKTPVLGVLVGALVTVLIQSSSATTVMTVSFVDAGLMTLKQAVGLIMGANIGTTVTGQILAFKIKDFAYLFIIIGVLFSFFGRSSMQKYVGNGLFGFGLLFVGMQTMESSMAFLRDRQDIFLMFSAHPLLGVLAGTLLTLLVQSSSATVGLTIALGMQGLLPLEAAIPIILGDNIGTTITAALASIGADRVAKQACAAHILFNVIGVCIFLPLLSLYVPLIARTADTIGHQIANAHSLFNICNTLIMLPFVTPFTRLIRRLIPDDPAGQKVLEGPKYLDKKLLSTPVMAMEAVRNECAHIGELAVGVLDHIHAAFFQGKPEAVRQAIHEDATIDSINRAIQVFSDRILRAGIASTPARVLALYVAGAADIERVGDQGKKLAGVLEMRRELTRDFSPEALHELDGMFTEARTVLHEAVEALTGDAPGKAEALIPRAKALRTVEIELRNRHLQRMDEHECDAEAGFVFVEALGLIEMIGYLSKNLAKSAANIAKVRS